MWHKFSTDQKIQIIIKQNNFRSLTCTTREIMWAADFLNISGFLFLVPENTSFPQSDSLFINTAEAGALQRMPRLPTANPTTLYCLCSYNEYENSACSSVWLRATLLSASLRPCQWAHKAETILITVLTPICSLPSFNEAAPKHGISFIYLINVLTEIWTQLIFI